MQTKQKYFVKGTMNEMRLTEEQAKQIQANGLELSGPFPEVEGNGLYRPGETHEQWEDRMEGGQEEHESFNEEKWSERYT
jgi:hypothetical protein